MATERGNLVFLAGSAQNIEFRTGSLGKIKLNEEDLGECLHQVIQWKYMEVILCIHIQSFNSRGLYKSVPYIFSPGNVTVGEVSPVKSNTLGLVMGRRRNSSGKCLIVWAYIL